ncbi:outer membrane protein [Methylocella sp.]|uniref:outer membrane protein n=1 Tax=Methylocella sp. TaxID=1978226 RepID=UPI0037846303
MLRRALLTTLAPLCAGPFCAAALCVGAAQAADLPYGSEPSYAPAPLFTWTGFYIGGQIGYAWGQDDINGWSPYYAFSGVSYSPSGVVGGAHVGYNYQINRFVLGLEGDVEGSGLSKNYAFGGVIYGTSIPVQGGVRGRLGVSFDKALLYVTGGAAFAGVDTTYQSWSGYTSQTSTRAGWTVGGGLEYAITPNWSARAEYRYADLGSFTNQVYAAGVGASVNHHPTTQTVRLGFSYRFGSTPFWQ